MAGDTLLELENFLPYRLSVLSNMVSQAIAREYEDRFALSITEWRVVAVLGRYDGLSAREVAERTAMDKVAVSRAVAELMKDGRVLRSTAAHDKRQSVLSLTAAGREADAIRLLDDLNAKMPFSVIPGDARSWSYMARSYLAAGANQKATALANQAMPLALNQLETAQGENQQYAVGFFQMLRALLIAGNDFEAAARLSSRVATLVGNPSLAQTVEQLRAEVDTTRRSLGLAVRGTRPDTARPDTARR